MKVHKGPNDFHTSVERALEDINKDWHTTYHGDIIVGSHAPSDIDVKLEVIRQARENGTPLLGICLGMQLMVMEFAKNVLGIEDATLAEISEEGTPVTYKLPELHIGQDDGESYWHNYAIKPEFAKLLDEKFFVYYLKDTDIVKEIRMENHPFFVGVQYHPEYQSTKGNPHLLLTDMFKTCEKIKSE